MFVAKSPVSKKIYKLAVMLKETDMNIYIYGEEGTGKTFLANFIASSKDEIIENITSLPSTTKRVIATGNKKLYDDLADFFVMQIELKPLSERKDDVGEFINLFLQQAKKDLKIDNDIFIEYNNENLHQLKKKIYKLLLCSEFDKNEMIDFLKCFFSKNYKNIDTYNSMLKIFDKALISSLLEKYKSKLQVAKILKINRNTLSKKVKDFENES